MTYKQCTVDTGFEEHKKEVLVLNVEEKNPFSFNAIYTDDAYILYTLYIESVNEQRSLQILYKMDRIIIAISHSYSVNRTYVALFLTVNKQKFCDTWRFLHTCPTRRFRLGIDSAVDAIFILLYLIAV